MGVGLGVGSGFGRVRVVAHRSISPLSEVSSSSISRTLSAHMGPPPREGLPLAPGPELLAELEAELVSRICEAFSSPTLARLPRSVTW